MRELLYVEFFVTTVGEWTVVGYITLLMTTVPSSDARVYSSWVGTSGGSSSHRTSVLDKLVVKVAMYMLQLIWIIS